MNAYEDQLARLGPLAPVAVALVDYAKALAPGAEFVQKGRRWVSEPNFLAFEVRSARSHDVIFSLYGVPTDFKRIRALPLQLAYRISYSEFRLNSPRQLGAAASYIATSFALSKSKGKRGARPKIGDLEEIL
jgi:hypothetical protein